MKKSKKILGILILSTAIIFPSLSYDATAVQKSEKNKPETFRVLIQSSKASHLQESKQKFGVRWQFNGNEFTTNVNEIQYEALQNNKNLKVEKVNQVSIDFLGNSTQATLTDQTPWGIEAIYNNPSLTETTGGENIRVAVLDTGTNKNHSDLENQVEQCKDFSSFFFKIINNSCADRNGHGTHVAGTVLADGGDNGQGIYGVAPDSKLWTYKVLGDLGFGFSDDIAGAIRHAADEGKRLGVKVIISMSLGSTGKDELIAEAVSYANSKGTLVIAAAGNEGPNENTIGYPGALKDAVAVAALEDVQENRTYRVANFSSRGNPASDGDYVIVEQDVEVSAPGRDILSTWYDGSYNTISGTSMATPHVSGLAAKIWSENPGFSNADLRSELQNRAKTHDIKGGLHATDGDDIASGFGFPQVR
ncbi:subtilisin [Bacillus pakistanensis]|uniref:Subtilisin n=1 Tax=Rossellomorea pakistanensis TaxID=992288 RepID=A0ABS2NE70_9BACI|nr:S8 family peptidase [Bacillus pakistanensis]MBM7586156.1 subtilisin [Bacillus pakistanensis]